MNRIDFLIYPEKVLPSTEFYVISFLTFRKYSFIFWYPEFYPEERFNLIIVRYLSNELVKFMRKYRKLINQIYYFMDDDLWDINNLRYLPLKYAFKIFKFSLRYKKFLLKNDAILLVSNRFLYEKYRKYNPLILFPYPPYKTYSQTIIWKDNPLVFYHATSSHNKEFFWLRELVKTMPERKFEIICDNRHFKIFKDLSNCYKVYPLSWEAYKFFIGLPYRQIGLAFQLDTPFNRARSYVKFFNIIRAGAVGIYSDTFPESYLIKKFEAGKVVPFTLEAFKEAILSLDEASAKYFYTNSLKLLDYLKIKAEESYKKIYL